MNLEPLIYWVRERENIRLKRAAGEPPPWTDDPLLVNYRFCNVRREDDRVTRWIHDNIRVPYAKHPYLWWMLCAARMINWPPTLAALIRSGEAWPTADDLSQFSLGAMAQVMQDRKDRGEKVYTGAYMIRAETDPNVHWYSWSKQRFIAEIVLGNLWRDRDQLTPSFHRSLEEAVTTLLPYRNWGPFMSYQAVVDMRWCDGLLALAEDRGNYAAAGPGTIRGLNRLHGRPVDAKLTQSRALEELRELYPYLKEIVDLDFSDVPNVCCEVDKMLRLRNKEGTVRAKYDPLKTIYF